MTHQKWCIVQQNSHKGIERDRIINTQIIESADYKRKIESFGEDEDTSKEMWLKTTEMLKHRSGTRYEDLIFVNSIMNDSLVRTDYNVEKEVNPSKRMKDMLKNAPEYTIIGIHNHPDSTPPSIDDIMIGDKRKYKFGIVACHNGDLYKYTIQGNVNNVNANIELDAIKTIMYNKENMSPEDFESRLDGSLSRLLEAGVKLEIVQ